MIRFNIDRFAWVLVALAVVGVSGCKQVSTRSAVAPSVSPPMAPYGYDPPDDTYLHRPESAPRLEAVPSLPAPGHTSPIDPPPPAPAPDDSAAIPTGDSITAAKAPWALRPMSFFNRKDAKSDVRPATADAGQQQASAPGKQPTLLPKPESTRWAPTNREIVLPRQASSVPNAPNVMPRSLDDSYTGPVITPGSQYTAARNAPIEDWPRANRQVAEYPAVRLRKQPEPISSDAFVPVAPTQQRPLPASIQPEPSAATVPLLLPPGP